MLLPKLQSVQLEDTSTVSVVTFDFVAHLMSLLHDNNLMQWDNLALNPDDPFAPYSAAELSECHSAQCYQTMYTQMHINKDNNELLCPLILYVDKTNVDKFSRFAVEPLSFTLSMFKYKTRCYI